MLPEKIIVVKPVFTLIQNPKSKKNLKFLLLLSVFLLLIISPGAVASSSWELSPENPVVGDTITVKGTGFEGETAKVMVTFEKEVQVEDGKYEYVLEDVEIPSGNDNRFTVKATGADDLNVRAKTLLWITKNGEAKDGIATVSQTNVPGGTYEIRIDGKASGSKVKLKITAMQEIELDSKGSLNYEYNTESIPAGNFEVKVGDTTKEVEFQPGENVSSGGTSSSEQNSSEGNKSEKNSWNNLKLILSYPYSLRSFYTVNESVKLSYKGSDALAQQNVEIYLIKERSPSCPENAVSNSMNKSTISLEDFFNNNTESYIQIPATLNKYGDLSPMTLGSLSAGNYWALITRAGNETERPESEKEILLADYFEVLEYEMDAESPSTLEEGENFEVKLDLRNVPSQENYTYWAVLIREDACTTDDDTNSSCMTDGIRPIVNGVDIIRSLETNLTGYESRAGKDKLKEEIQTHIGKENGTISIGEKNQSTLSLKNLELPSGDYLLVAGACENNGSLAGIAQKKLKISAENSSGLSLEPSSVNRTLSSISSMKFKASPFLGVKSILRTPKEFIFEDIKPYIQGKTLTEIIRNPPKVPSFLLSFAGTLLAGLAILKKLR